MLDYTIIVPSRKRVKNMPLIRSLLPDALICVDQREVADYMPHVPVEKMLIHPPMEGLGTVLNWAMFEIKTEILIAVDDDFKGVLTMVSKQRKITNPDDILAILLNAAQACQDLSLSIFTFTRSANPILMQSAVVPVRPVAPICNAFGIMNKARHRKYDMRFIGRADVDFTLRTLLEDRAIYADMRFYFDCGSVYAGKGGNVGLVSKAQFDQSTELLQAKYGKYFSAKGLNFQKTQSKQKMRINVVRHNPMAQK